jgi:hypothetical protein
MAKPPLNYTTTIPAVRTIGECQQMLGEAGAAAVAVMYASKEPAGLSFRLATASGMQDFALPVNIEGVWKLLRDADYPASLRPAVHARYVTREHAVRVGWRVVRDWLEAQLAFVAAEMVTLDEVMLPYLQVGDGVTLYRALQSNRLALTAGGAR